MNQTLDLCHLDDSQLRVVRATGGHHLVLAPPGCGKTHVLTERIRYAHAQGLAYGDMLCLTFTNRAAREMLSRVAAHITDADDLSVGSIHRFCSRFLMSGGHVAADTSIIDDEEAVSIIADYMFEDADHVMNDHRRFAQYQEIIFFSHMMQQMESGHDDSLFLHPEVLNESDRQALRRLCQLQHLDFGRQALIEIYHHADNYKNDAFAPLVSRQMRSAILRLALKMYYAYSYATYKREHHLIDFEDLLILTYDIYRSDTELKRYPWIQVDEVQDLNAMQLAIIDQLTAPQATVMYLGDEQQAIFSFMGAKLETLDVLRLRCKGHLYHLAQNHRSPSYLLDVFNLYAEHVLHIHRDLLPTTDRQLAAPEGALRLLHSQTDNAEIIDVVRLTQQLLVENDTDTTAIIVSTNREADNISAAMATQRLPHFKVSGRDIFSTRDMRLLLAHLDVLHNEHVFVPWARLLVGLKAIANASLARRFVFKLQQLSITPSDLLAYDDTMTYTQDFARHYEQSLVVFDTETTGTNTQEDDIIEIAAMRLIGGKLTGEQLDLYIETQREIPAMLGEKPNPMCAIYAEKKAAGELLQPAEALLRFIDFVGESAVLGHNVHFDYHIVDAQMRRHLGHSMSELPSAVFDSLKLSRLLFPHLPSYKLERLLEQLQLAGQNSHQAIDDVDATVHLTTLCYEKAREKTAQQRNFLQHDKVLPITSRLRSAYRDLYLTARDRLYQRGTKGCAMLEEMSRAYRQLLDAALIKPISKLGYVEEYVARNILVDDYADTLLVEQLHRAMMELNTMKEADFCQTSCVRERIYVTTVHKAKGLEFSNVIVYDVSKGRYPDGRSTTKHAQDEDARRLYVAMSRAQKRLIFSYPLQNIDRYGRVHDKELSPFLTPLLTKLNI